MTVPRFHKLIPGAALEGDWFAGTIPANIAVGDNCVIDSSFCFKHFYSSAEPGLVLGSDVTLWRTALSVEEDGVVEIGDTCYLSNAAIVCSRRISIGSRVMVAGGVTIADSDFHPLTPALRLADTIALAPGGNRDARPAFASEPVSIADDVWIGCNAAILKGVTIGEGAIIAPGSVVIRDVPSGVEVAGNPAKPVREVRP